MDLGRRRRDGNAVDDAVDTVDTMKSVRSGAQFADILKKFDQQQHPRVRGLQQQQHRMRNRASSQAPKMAPPKIRKERVIQQI
jgi:hypothetical protein